MEMKILALAFALSALFTNVEGSEQGGLAHAAPCPVTNTVCEFWMEVEERRTMHFGGLKVLSSKRKLYGFNESPLDIKTKIPLEEVITMDGYLRSVTAVNHTVPGPPIVVHVGQKVIIHVLNKLLAETVTIHWHGIEQLGTPFMDGVSFVSQCPILPHQTFTYKFTPHAHGTFFYHSHVASQRVDGLFGALIVKPKGAAFREYNAIEDHIMHVGDWFHEHASAVYSKKKYGGYNVVTANHGIGFPITIFSSAHIEGRGDWYNHETGKWLEAPLKIYKVTPGKKYRFRMIGTGMEFPMRVSVDGHKIAVTASDAFDVVPAEGFESIMIYPGERYDFHLLADKPVGNYWVRADTYEPMHDLHYHYSRAILRYDGAPDADPTSDRLKCTPKEPCKILNCPVTNFGAAENKLCVAVDKLKREGGEKTPIWEADSEEHHLNFVAAHEGMLVNGKIFKESTVSSGSQPNDIDYKAEGCDRPECIGKICHCHHEIEVPFNKTIQMVWTNVGSGARFDHPIHLHGHSFHVLKMGYGRYDGLTGMRSFPHDNSDIACKGPPFPCYEADWKDKSFKGDNIPGLNLVNPMQKDTLLISTGSYAVIRFRSLNPGKWFMHCHLEVHTMDGMAIILNEAPDHQPKPPVGFPICHGFRHDPKIDKKFAKKQCPNPNMRTTLKGSKAPIITAPPTDPPTDPPTKPATKEPVATKPAATPAKCECKTKKKWNFDGVTDVIHILFFIFLGLFVIETIILIICFVGKKKNSASDSVVVNTGAK